MSDGMPEDSVTVVLKKPITIEGKQITHIVVNEPTAAHMAMAEQQTKNAGGVEQGIALLALACGIHQNVVKQLCGSDYVKAQKVMGNFFDDTQETGENT